MSRMWILDPLQNRRASVYDSPTSLMASGDIPSIGMDWLTAAKLSFSLVAGGFSSISVPDITVETQDIPQGIMAPPVKAIIGATIGNVTLSRGVFAADKEFHNWILKCIQGKEKPSNYRRNLLILWLNDSIGVNIGVGEAFMPMKALILENVFPVRYKLAGDFDASTASVAIQELELCPAEFKLVDIAGTLG